MPGQLVYPPDYPILTGPVLFLAGPIRGAPDWHADAVRLVRELAAELHIANPKPEKLPDSFEYAAQIDWEWHFLRKAGNDGAILFWLAREAEHHCDRAYAQTTRFELAEWKVRHERDGAKIVVGIEDGFSGGKYIRHRLTKDCPGMPIRESLEETVRTAVGMV